MQTLLVPKDGDFVELYWELNQVLWSAPQLDDEAMASMLADFVACPPDDEDHASGSKWNLH